MIAHQLPPCCGSFCSAGGAAAAGVPVLLRRGRRPLTGLAGVPAAAAALAALLLRRRLATPPLDTGVLAAAAPSFLAALGVRAARGALAGVRPGVPLLPVLVTWRAAEVTARAVGFRRHVGRGCA